MTWDPSADELYPHYVTLVAPGAMNAYGRNAEGSPTLERSAHVEFKMRMVRDVAGEKTMSSVTVYINGQNGTCPNLTTEWKVTLPDGTSRPILSVDRYADEDGDLHEVIHLQ